MSLNPNWPRWILASVSYHFDGYRGSIPLYVEGQTKKIPLSDSGYELRYDGPNIAEGTLDDWSIEIDINLLVKTLINLDSLEHQRDIGQMMAGFTHTIGVFKFGSGGGDDDSQIGCLQLVKRDGRNTIEINQFGQIGASSINMQQSTIDALYRLVI